MIELNVAPGDPLAPAPIVKNPRGRPARAEASRTMEARSYERKPVAYLRNGKFSIPLELKEMYPDKVFAWVRFAFKNSGEDRENYLEAVDDGYQPVPPTACPELARRQSITPFERQSEGSDDLIRRDGLALMWCDKDIYDARQAYYDEALIRYQQMAAICQSASLSEFVDQREVSGKQI